MRLATVLSITDCERDDVFFFLEFRHRKLGRIRSVETDERYSECDSGKGRLKRECLV